MTNEEYEETEKWLTRCEEIDRTREIDELFNQAGYPDASHTASLCEEAEELRQEFIKDDEGSPHSIVAIQVAYDDEGDVA